jgi:transposase-like protein
MSYRCPDCHSKKYIKFGSFRRKSDSKIIQRFKCRVCFKHFSSATFSDCYGQNKRRVNSILGKLLCSGISQRRAALILKINPKTVARKLIFLAQKARQNHFEFIESYYKKSLQKLQFDDLITTHHTKLKPLTVSVAVDSLSRMILDVQVGEIAAFGHLADLSKRKYGRRKSQHKRCLKDLFNNIHHLLDETTIIESDEHKFYREFVEDYAPHSPYTQFKSKPASVAGQGELKTKGRDPLFAINHTLAMMRANINRLFRRTWNTTKNISMLTHHLWLYVEFHNRVLIKN